MNPSELPRRQDDMDRSTGYLRRFFLPPLSVILVSGFLALLLSQIQVDLASTAPLPPNSSSYKTPPPDDGIADLFTLEIQYWEEDILAWSEEYQLDPNLVATVMQIESCGYNKAKSAADAKGLFQVMPQHFKKKEDPFDPDINALRGLAYLKKSLDSSGGSIQMALAGYNAGISRAKSGVENWPNETQRYVYWGNRIYSDAQMRRDHSPRLDDWLSRGGKYLCERAAKEQAEQ